MGAQIRFVIYGCHPTALTIHKYLLMQLIGFQAVATFGFAS